VVNSSEPQKNQTAVEIDVGLPGGLVRIKKGPNEHVSSVAQSPEASFVGTTNK
jgi:hypothetical protein